MKGKEGREEGREPLISEEGQAMGSQEVWNRWKQQKLGGKRYSHSPLLVEKLIFGGTPHLTFLVSAPDTHTETSDGILAPFTTGTHCAVLQVGIEVGTRRLSHLGVPLEASRNSGSLAPR